MRKIPESWGKSNLSKAWKQKSDNGEMPNLSENQTSTHSSVSEQVDEANPSKENIDDTTNSVDISSANVNGGKQTQPNRYDNEDISLPEVKKINHSKKTSYIIMIVIIAVLIVSLSILMCLYIFNQKDSDKSPLESITESTESVKTEISSNVSSAKDALNPNDYLGFWHLEGGPDELAINDISDKKVKFSYWSYPRGLIEMTANLDGSIASFSYNQDGITLKGFLTFNPDSISFDITESNDIYMPNISYIFKQRSQQTWVQSYDTIIPEENYELESYPSDQYPDYEEYPNYTESPEVEVPDYISEPDINPWEPDTDISSNNSQEPDTSVSSSSSFEPEKPGVELEKDLFGVGEEHTQTVNGVTFHWYDEYVYGSPTMYSVKIHSITFSYDSGFRGNTQTQAPRYECNFEVEVSSGRSINTFWFNEYDEDGYFLDETPLILYNGMSKIQGKCKGEGQMLNFDKNMKDVFLTL